MSPSSLLGTYMENVKTRPTTINWVINLKAIVDGYDQAEGIVHGVQKDAIQNGWDARNNKKGKGWKFTFELIESNDRSYLCMIDEGTHGLTGRVLDPSDLEKDLPPEERWGRFENMAYTKDQSKERATLGSRGRGKFIFVGAAKNNEIMYDSLRNDNTYRLGVRNLVTTNSLTYSWDEEEGKQKLLEISNQSITPLTKIGTRVIIIDPIDELVDSIKNGEFIRDISETWWELFQKYDAQICVKYNGQELMAQIPEEFDLPETDDENNLIWIKKHDKRKSGKQEFTVKKLHIVFNKKENIPNDIQGVSIQRGGMKVCSVAANYLSRDISNHLYGYCVLGKDSEFELHKYEGPEHYSFIKRAYPEAIKRYIASQINQFAREKLGWGRDERAVKRQRTKNAERKALAAINDVASKMGLSGLGVGRKGGGGGGSRSSKPIRIRMSELELPRNNDLRVNYGEIIRNIGCEVLNNTTNVLKIRLKIYLRYYDSAIHTFLEKDIEINANSTSELIGPFELECNQNDLSNTGVYTIVCRIISLLDESKGDIFDEKKKVFYLEMDPPKAGLFESCDGMPFPEHVNHIMGEAIPGSRGGWILQYNMNHPEFVVIQDEEDNSALYLFKIMGHELCRIDSTEDMPILYEKDKIDSPDYVLTRTLDLLGQFSSQYFGG